jgi:hypothetical protein
MKRHRLILISLAALLFGSAIAWGDGTVQSEPTRTPEACASVERSVDEGYGVSRVALALECKSGASEAE